MNQTIHDLTLLYLQNQDIHSLSPEELYNKYKATYEQIKTYHDSQKSSSVSVLK